MGMCGSCTYFEWNKKKEQWFCNLSDSTGYQKYTMDNMVCHSKKNGREGYQLVPDTGGIQRESRKLINICGWYEEKELCSSHSYLKSLADLTRGEYPNRPHFILAAPSGCGKTETYRVLEQVLREIPHLSVSQVDVSSITEAGYKGPDPDVLFTDIRSKMGNDTRGIGIVFMDEFDKKLSPSLGEHGTDNNLAVQNQLLTIIEGSKYNGKRGCEIDTRYTLFIGLGSFSKARQERELVKDTIGFTGKTAEKETHYSPITREDILSTGASYELLGRFLGIVNYQPLQEPAIRRILDNIARDLSDIYHIRISFSESGYQAFIRLANGEFGCRSLKNQVWNTVFPALRREMISGNERTAEYRIEDIDLCQKMDEPVYVLVS